MSKYSRLKYNNINVDFDRGLSAFSPLPIQIKNVAVSRAGIAETRNFYRYWTFAFARAHAHAGLKNQIMAFWDYVRTGASFSFWHDRDLASYWNFEGKTLSNIDEVAATFARATTAYNQDPDTGLLTSVASGTPRFPAGKYGRGVLVEQQSVNLLTAPEDASNVAWIKTSLTVSTNTTETLDPEGGTNADRLVTTGANATLVQETATNIGTSDGVFSVYLKNKQIGDQAATIELYRVTAGTTLATKAITITSSWQRFYVAYDSAGSITDNWAVRIIFPQDAETFYWKNAMLEAGVAQIYPTSYHATTRNRDDISYAAANFFNDEPTQGTIAFWFKPNFASTELAGVLGYLFTIDSFDGGGNTIMVLTIGSANGINLIITNKHGFDGINVSYSLPAFSSSDFMHISITWDTTIANGGKIYLNGVLGATSSNSYFPIKRLGTNLYLGRQSSGAVAVNGIFDDMLIRKDVLDAAEIAEIASGQQPLGYDRNYWAALMIEERQYTQNRLAGVPLWDIEIPVREVIS